MAILPKSIQKLIDEFSKLPGIGPKTAARLSFYLLSKSDEDVHNLGKTIYHLKREIKTCGICFNIAEQNPCSICQNKNRDKSIIMAVENPLDVLAFEKTGEYKGLYHIIGGAISPVDDIGPENLRIAELLDRIKQNSENIKEIVLATNPNLEGEATAMYINNEILKLKSEILKLKKINKFVLHPDKSVFKIKITRIARGLPVGGDLEYADEITLSRALEGRKEY